MRTMKAGHLPVFATAMLLTGLLCDSSRIAAEDGGLLRWVVRVADADPESSEPRLYRIYENPERVTLVLTMANESAETLLVDQSALQRDVRFTIDGGEIGGVETVVNWSAEAKQGGLQTPIVISEGDVIRIEPGKGIEWTVRLQRADAERFVDGRYRIVLALSNARGNILTAHGQPWRGHALRSTDVSVVVAPPAGPGERAASFRLVGEAALSANQPLQALQAFQRARAADPSDPLSMIGLGDAYLRLDRFAEAVNAFESALRVRPLQRSGVPIRLALAYVGNGDESNAARVLRSTGLREQRIQSEIERYRSIVRGRRR